MEDEDEEYIRLSDEQMERERKITRLIFAAFQKLGIEIERDVRDRPVGIYYDESMDREAAITLEELEVPISQLAALYQSGLSHNYVIAARGTNLEVRFVVDPALDHAIEG